MVSSVLAPPLAFELPWHLSLKPTDQKCEGLFLEFLLCSIDLYSYLHASSTILITSALLENSKSDSVSSAIWFYDFRLLTSENEVESIISSSVFFLFERFMCN